MKNDFGPDSGLFLRSTEQGKAYQALINYHADGNLMGVYGEGFPTPSSSANSASPTSPAKSSSLIAFSRCPSHRECGPGLLKPGRWNTFAAPHRGKPADDRHVDQRRSIPTLVGQKKHHPDQGGLALQVTENISPRS